MKPLDSLALSGHDSIDSILAEFSFREHESLSKDEVLGRLDKAGYAIRKLKPTDSKASFLTCDCSVAFRQLRYHSLWAAHAVAVYAQFDGRGNPDVLVGNGTVPYSGLEHSSYLDVGEFIPYSDVDVRGNCARAGFEFASLLKAYDELASEGVSPDYVLVDGSLYTNLSNKEASADYPECVRAKAAFAKALGLGKVVGLVEDSHATDISRRLGYDHTNMLLFDVALSPGEYAVDAREGVNICYLKLPGKPLPYLPSGASRPLTVRWEFNYAEFEGDLGLLVGIWLSEDDLLHPQLYPLRIADHLSRKIKAAGILDELVAGRGLDLKYRDMREG